MTGSSGVNPIGVRFSRHVRHLVGELWSADADRAVSAAELIAACDNRPTSLVDLASALCQCVNFLKPRCRDGSAIDGKDLGQACRGDCGRVHAPAQPRVDDGNRPAGRDSLHVGWRDLSQRSTDLADVLNGMDG
jgi:hypothetical protein